MPMPMQHLIAAQAAQEADIDERRCRTPTEPRDMTAAADPADSIELGKPSTVITWGKEKRDDPPVLGQPDSETTWSKREAEKPKDVFKLGKATTVVTWS